MNSAVALLSAAALGSCNLYKKFEMPEDSALTKEYSEAVKAGVDSAAFGNLRWEQVFTDPVLADLIRQALANNIDLRNSQLNVEIAQARLKGAKLNYLPSVAFAPNGALSKYFVDGSSWGKTYQLPLQVSWEVDIFGRLLNSKRAQQVALLQTQGMLRQPARRLYQPLPMFTTA